MKKYQATISIDKNVTLFAINEREAEKKLLIELTEEDIQVSLTEMPNTNPLALEYTSLRDMYSTPTPKTNYTPLLRLPAANYVRFVDSEV